MCFCQCIISSLLSSVKFDDYDDDDDNYLSENNNYNRLDLEL